MRDSGYRLGLAARCSLLGAAAAMADRLADVAQRLWAADVREDVEVVRLGRGEREPLERVAAPGVVAGGGAVGAAEDRVEDRHQQAGEEDEDPDRRDHVVGGEAAAAEVLVGVGDLALVVAG